MAAHYAKKEKKNRGKRVAVSKKRRLWLNIAIVVLLCVLGFSGYKVVTILINYHEGNSSYANIANDSVSSGAIWKPSPDAVGADDLPEDQEFTGVEVDFSQLSSVNSDVTGWLYSDGTVINYPIVQCSDNDYYLNHRFDGTYSSFGTLFTDYRGSADFTDRQTLLYGHNMDNGSMFASLLKYRNQSYYDEHPYMLLYTPEKTYIVALFSAYVAATDDWCYQRVYSDEEYGSYLDYVESQSDFQSQVTVTENDRIVVFSTCAYDFDDARYVVFGKLVEAVEEGTAG